MGKPIQLILERQASLHAPVWIGSNGKFLASTFFAIFRLVPEWSWDALPSSYRNNPTISVSISITHNQEMDATDTLSATQQDSNTQLDDDILITDTLDLPTKQVGRYKP